MEQGPTVWEMSSGGYQVYGGGKLVTYSVSLSSYSFIFDHALLLLQKQSSKRQLVAVTGVKLVSSQYFATAACSSLPQDLWVMVEDDRGKIISTSLLLRPCNYTP